MNLRGFPAQMAPRKIDCEDASRSPLTFFMAQGVRRVNLRGP
jgi:hypothetical protein